MELLNDFAEMDERGNADGSLISRIEQLQHERDELRKDIEQLCLQQAGPSYLSVATRMHFQRTAGMEQEIESLKKKLAGCTREKQNLEEELAEAYRIKSQLADLHNADGLKNKEAEKQLKFLQSSVAATFSERDHALMECEKAQEREEAASDRLTTAENRVKELQSLYENEKKLNADLQMELMDLKEQTESFEKVINKFYDILQKEIGSSGADTWQGKCSRLLDDPSDHWIFNSDSKTSTSKYIKSGLATKSILMDRTQDASETLAQALQEKVAALLLLSQQEERHLLERDVNHALQKKMEELQRNLSQVTNEKVQALLELAQLKQEYQLLQESCGHVPKHGKSVDDVYEKSITVHVQEGKLKNLLKRSYLRNWIGKGLSEETNIHGSTDESGHASKKNVYSADFARLKVENATLQESIANLEHLTSSIHRLFVTLLKARDEAASAGNKESITEALRIITAEASHLKTALGSSLPVSWSADAAVAAATYENLYEPTDHCEAIKDCVDPVSSAGLEMVKLVMLAAQLIEDFIGSSSTD